MQVWATVMGWRESRVEVPRSILRLVSREHRRATVCVQRHVADLAECDRGASARGTEYPGPLPYVMAMVNKKVDMVRAEGTR